MALRRSFLTESDRRGLQLHVKRAIQASAHLLALSEGASKETQENTLEENRVKQTRTGSKPAPPAQKNAFLMQAFFTHAGTTREITATTALNLKDHMLVCGPCFQTWFP